MYLNQKYIIEPLESLLPIKNISMDIYLPEMISSKDSLDLKMNSDNDNAQQGLISSVDSIDINADVKTEPTEQIMVSSKDSLDLNIESESAQDFIKNTESDLSTTSALEMEKLNENDSATTNFDLFNIENISESISTTEEASKVDENV